MPRVFVRIQRQEGAHLPKADGKNSYRPPQLEKRCGAGDRRITQQNNLEHPSVSPLGKATEDGKGGTTWQELPELTCQEIRGSSMV